MLGVVKADKHPRSDCVLPAAVCISHVANQLVCDIFFIDSEQQSLGYLSAKPKFVLMSSI